MDLSSERQNIFNYAKTKMLGDVGDAKWISLVLIYAFVPYCQHLNNAGDENTYFLCKVNFIRSKNHVIKI